MDNNILINNYDDNTTINNEDVSDNMSKNEINSQDILDAIDLNKINQVVKKKRGRPKKKELMMMTNSKVKTNNNEKTYNLEEEEIILHLPLSNIDLNNIDDMDDIIKKNDTIKTSNNNINLNKEFDGKDNYIDNSSSDVIDNSQYIKQLCLTIKKLKDENIELKKYLTDITPMYFTEIKVYPCKLNLFDSCQNKLIPTKTDIHCWWCTHQFDNLPTFIPEKYSDNNFYVYGCFCSFNCAGAYNLSLGDNKVWDRYSLLKLMYYYINIDKINSICDIDINIAGPKELLKKYGGTMTIDEYRKNSKILGREYHKLIPPFIPIDIGFHEITNQKNNLNIPNLSNILNSSKNFDNIVKRTKPLNNSASKQIDSFV